MEGGIETPQSNIDHQCGSRRVVVVLPHWEAPCHTFRSASRAAYIANLYDRERCMYTSTASSTTGQGPTESNYSNVCDSICNCLESQISRAPAYKSRPLPPPPSRQLTTSPCPTSITHSCPRRVGSGLACVDIFIPGEYSRDAVSWVSESRNVLEVFCFALGWLRLYAARRGKGKGATT